MEVAILTKDEIRSIIRQEFIDLMPKNPEVQQKRFTLAEAAEYLQLPIPSFRLHQSRIGGVKIGRNWFFTKAELDRYVERNRRVTMAEIRESM